MRGGDGRADDGSDEQLAGQLHRGELQSLLGPEQGLDTGLAQSGVRGQPAEAEPVEPGEGGDVDGSSSTTALVLAPRTSRLSVTPIGKAGRRAAVGGRDRVVGLRLQLDVALILHTTET